MKKLLGFLMMGAVMLSSCGNDHEDLYDPNAAALLKANEYAKAFVKQFGKIDPNHTWGFGDALASRASVSGAVDNPQNYNMERPTPITPEEKTVVTNWFKNNQNPTSIELNWSDFWLQQISSNDAYTNHINQLALNDDEPVERFNNSPADGLAMYIQNSLSTNFSYHDSYGEERIYNKYVICEIGGEYYLGFDYCSNKVGEAIVADGYYCDWIIKLTPCTYVESKRIIAEDLGDSDDFDFNDVVFDVAFDSIWDGEIERNVNYAVVTLLAAGGTLPLSINGHEVHELFGVSTNTMVNTGNTSKEKVIFRIPDMSNLSDIKIMVNDATAVSYQLNTNIGGAPQMICVDTDFVWPKERQSIDELYNFVEYTNSESVGLVRK